VFLSEPEMQGVEALTRYETVLRLVARVRPLEQWRTARELRRRIRDRLDELDIGHPAPDGGTELHISRVDPGSGTPVPAPTPDPTAPPQPPTRQG
jgi:moderate conductance mechanosensitive channel